MVRAKPSAARGTEACTKSRGSRGELGQDSRIVVAISRAAADYSSTPIRVTSA